MSICPQCARENPAEARFCERCGTPLATICPACGQTLSPDARFCHRCGRELRKTSGPDRLVSLRRSAPAALQAKFHAAAAQLEGARKPVTILFTDIVGSTSLAEKLDPEDWRTILMGAHQRVSEAVYRYEGTIAQLLGDGVLAFFGAPITHEDDPVRAVRAALDIQRAIHDYADQLRSRVDNFQLRVGINTGVVVVGSIGSDLHMEYLAIGDAVNLAARLQSAAQPGRVLISEATEKLVKAAIDLTALGEITVKGKAEPVKVFEVIERKATPASGRGLDGFATPLVGRAYELNTLQTAVTELATGHGQIITIMGEAGIGKSRLVEETQHGAPQGRVRWLEGRALSYGQSLSFWTITQLIKNDLGLSDVDPEPKIKVALRRRMTMLFGSEAGEAGAHLAQLLGVKFDGMAAQPVEHLPTLDAETLKQRLFETIVEYFARVAQAQPTVLVFEDLHWADPSSLQVLESLLALTDRVPLLLLLLARAERDQGWWQIKLRAETDYAHRYTELQLKPLSTAEQNQLVDELLQITDMPDATRRLMLDRSEGNPFYLEEVIHSLIEQGALVREADHWRASHDITTVQMPATLESVILARLDRLHDDARRTLQLAAVIGRTFLYRLLAVITAAQRQIDAILSELQRVDLVREKTRLPDLEYMFKHALTQEVAYNSLLVERRKTFHRQVGEALEGLFVDRLDEVYGLLAYHFGAAGEVEKTIEYTNKAGDRARELFAYQETITYYQQALAGLKAQQDYERAARTLMKIGVLYHTLFDFTRSQQAYDEGFALWQRVQRDQTPGTAQPDGPVFRLTLVEPITLDPALVKDIFSGQVVIQLFSGLVECTDRDVLPACAESWEITDDGCQYVFHLRAGMAWSDGRPLTAHDFEYAWKRALNPATHSGSGGFLKMIKGAAAYYHGEAETADAVGVRALDDLTLVVELDGPASYFLQMLAHSVTYPVPRHAIEAYGTDWDRPGKIVGNGAFQLVAWEPGQSLSLTRNPHFTGRRAGNVERLEILCQKEVVLDPTIAVRLYEADQLDRVAPPLNNWSQVRKQYPAEFMSAPAAGVTYLSYRLSESPFSDSRVRRAFAHAIDRDRLEREALRDTELPARGGFIPPGLPGHSPALGLVCDPELAKQLLAEAGYPGGRGFPPVTLSVVASSFGRLRGECLQVAWQQVLNVPVVVVQREFFRKYAVARSARERSDLYLSGWVADYPDADGFLITFITDQVQGWRRDDFTQLIETARRTFDQTERIRLFQSADRILIEDAVAIPLGYQRRGFLLKPRIRRFRPSPLFADLMKDIVIES